MPISNRKSPAKKAAAPAKKATARNAAATVVEDVKDVTGGTDLFASFLIELKDLADKYLSPIGTSQPRGSDEDADDASEDDADVDETGEDEQDREEREAELNAMTARQVKTIALKYFEKEDLDGATKDEMVDNILDEEYGEDEGEADDEGGDDEDEEVTRDSLLALNLRDLKKLAVEKFEIEASDVKSADKDTIIDLILGEGEDESDDDAEEGEEGEDDEFWTREELQAMPIAEVRGIADDAGISYTAKQGKSKEALIDLIAPDEE